MKSLLQWFRIYSSSQIICSFLGHVWEEKSSNEVEFSWTLSVLRHLESNGRFCSIFLKPFYCDLGIKNTWQTVCHFPCLPYLTPGVWGDFSLQRFPLKMSSFSSYTLPITIWFYSGVPLASFKYLTLCYIKPQFIPPSLFYLFSLHYLMSAVL